MSSRKRTKQWRGMPIWLPGPTPPIGSGGTHDDNARLD